MTARRSGPGPRKGSRRTLHRAPARRTAAKREPGEGHDLLPVLYLVSQVVFPFGATQIRVRLERNLKVLDDLPRKDARLAIACAPGVDPEQVGPADLAPVGVAARVIARLKLPDGSEQVTLQGLERIRLLRFPSSEPYLVAETESVEEGAGDPEREGEQIQHILRMVEELEEIDGGIKDEDVGLLRTNASDPGRFADLVATVLDFEIAHQSHMLELVVAHERLEYVATLVRERLELARVAQETSRKTRLDIERTQREYYLRRQLKVLREELGETTREEQAAREATDRLEALEVPDAVEAAARREIERMRSTNASSAEFGVIQNYVDWLLGMPWSKTCTDRIDIAAVRKRLDADHFGLEEPKERILEHLAVRQLTKQAGGLVLCLVGPPGTGKTSLAQSMAEAMGRTMVRISVGGIRDESEIRGHRRTYVGAMPGRIAGALRRADCNNPVLVIDEIDKLGAGPQGDPSAAMLEVLDPEQNHTFVDHFLDVPVDLSRVLFVATANYLWDIPGPLRDRMEVIELSSYVEEEKVEIAMRHLVPRLRTRTGLPETTRLSRDTIRAIVRGYTYEAGVRHLSRRIAAVMRKLALRYASGRRIPRVVVPGDLRDLIGPPRIVPLEKRRRAELGVVNGLAWTASGGDILLIEGMRVPGSGEVRITGSLGDVMRESVYAAYSYVRSRADALDLEPGVFKKWDLHLHFPEGAVPKDGPSAGVAVVTAVVSLFTRRKVRADVAMTGEVTLRGKVLPVGGLREKLAAAARLGVRNVILPKSNEGDLHWVRESVRKRVRVHLVDHMDQVLDLALEPLRRSPRKAPGRRRARPA